MKWLDIPAHRVLEVEHDELMKEFDMYDEAGKLCGGGRVYLLFRKKDGTRFKFAQFSDLYGAVTRSASILRRFEALPIAIRQLHRSREPQKSFTFAVAVAAFYTLAGDCMYRQVTRQVLRLGEKSIPCVLVLLSDRI